MSINFRALADGEYVDEAEDQADDAPHTCSYCGAQEFEPEDTGRGHRWKCLTCGGTMTSGPSGYAQPELIGSPHNHPKQNADPNSGGVPGVWAPVLRKEQLEPRVGAQKFPDGESPHSSARFVDMANYFPRGGVESIPDVPWANHPRAREAWSGDAAWARHPIRQVPVNGLHHTQRTTLRQPWSEGDHPPVRVVRHEGLDWLLDGHHRVVNAIDDDQAHVPAHVLDLDDSEHHEASQRTAMPSMKHPPPEGLRLTDEGYDPSDDEHADLDSHLPGWDHRILRAHMPGRHNSGYLEYSVDHDHDGVHPGLVVNLMGTQKEFRSRGIASAMQDHLRSLYPTHVIEHGGRTTDGQAWWKQYKDPAPHLDYDNPAHSTHPEHGMTALTAKLTEPDQLHLLPVRSMGYKGFVEAEPGHEERSRAFEREHFPEDMQRPVMDEHLDHAVAHHGRLMGFLNGHIDDHEFWHKHGQVEEIDHDAHPPYATQPYLAGHHVERYLGNRSDPVATVHERGMDDSATSYPGTHYPMMVRHEGEHFIVEGHHRVAADMMKGQPTKTFVYDADKHGFPEANPVHAYDVTHPGLSKYARRRVRRCLFDHDDPAMAAAHALYNHDDGICVATESRAPQGDDVPDNDGDAEHTASLTDPEVGFHLTATWADVRNKAKRIRSEGGVNIVVASVDGIGGHVQGDTGVYETVLSYAPASTRVAHWTCGCAWAAYAWNRSPAFKRFEGRMCSHALALQYEAQSKGIFGKAIEESTQKPSWLREKVRYRYDRDTGQHEHVNASLRSPGDPDGVYPADHGLDLVRAPIYAFAVTALAKGADPSVPMAAMLELGMAHSAAREVLRDAMAGYDPYGEWDGRDDDEESEARSKDWDDIHSGMEGMHRGVGVMLKPHDHAIVHDQNRPLHERAEHLMRAIGEGSHTGGVGSHWTTERGVAEDFAETGPTKHLADAAKARAMESGDRRWGRDPDGDPKGQPATAVVFHAHTPDRHAIDENPDEMAHGSSSIYGYHDHGEREVPIHPGASLALKGLSFKPVHHYFDEPDFETPEYEHHSFDGEGHHVTAAAKAKKCPTCKGKGENEVENEDFDEHGHSTGTHMEPCEECGGTGMHDAMGDDALTQQAKENYAAAKANEDEHVARFHANGEDMQQAAQLGGRCVPSRCPIARGGEPFPSEDVYVKRHLRSVSKRIAASDHADDVWWHGTASGDLRGGNYGLHVGTHKAATDALTATIGHPAEGVWDGSRSYGETKLAGKKTLHERGIYPTGYSSRHAPDEDHYPTGGAKHGNGDPISMDFRPDIFPLRITGKMGNTPHDPHRDDVANSMMHRSRSAGRDQGYFYRNVGEDPGSVSAVLPGPEHIERIGSNSPEHEQKYRSAERYHQPLKDSDYGSFDDEGDEDGWHHEGAKKTDDGPTHAGLVLKAQDTGRILMLQRSLEDEKDPARGTWEFPGGGIEPEDATSFHGAAREFAEEVGQKVPHGGTLQHVWRSGPYMGHVLVVPHESLVGLTDGRIVPNPDDPGGDHGEQAAWWDPDHARKNPALREECKSAPWGAIKNASRKMAVLPGKPSTETCPDCHGQATRGAAACPHCGNHLRDNADKLESEARRILADYAANDSLGGGTPDGPSVGRQQPLPGDQENPASTGFATAADPPAFNNQDNTTNMRMPGDGGSFMASLQDEFAQKVMAEYHRLSELHTQPEPALPSTDGADDDSLWTTDVDPAHQHTPMDGTSGRPDPRDDMQQGVADLDSEGTPNSVHASVSDIVARFQATAAGKQLNGEKTGKGDSVDIAAAAREYLQSGMKKSALKDFSFQEQQELIGEGAADNSRARNLDDLRIRGTHYEALDAALSNQASLADPDDDLFI
jgi:8-oxo-dGTP pyrophosphatase MutT (NUDIX family)